MLTRRTVQSSSVKLLGILLIWSVVTAAVVHRYVFAVYVIQGSSMAPTLSDGDLALVNLMVSRIGQVERGEIVLVRDGFRDYATKRVVGLPGERIDFKDNKVYVNGRPLREIYIPKNARTTSACPTFLLGNNEYFVMGDNRPDSYDSRYYGPVSKDAIVGSYSKTFWACR